MVPQYILSSVMLEEHRQNVERFTPGPAVPGARTPVRLRLGQMLRAVADRLDPTGARVGGVKLLVMPYPGGATHDACSRREARP